MLLNSLQWKILQPFVDETVRQMNQTLELSTEADNGYQQKVEDFSFKGYAVVANTSGSVEGRILIHHYTETALAIGNRLLKRAKPSTPGSKTMDDNVSNALADFAYTIIESAVSTLKSKDLQVSFSQAYFISDTKKMDNLLEPVAEIITVPVRVDQVGRFYINYLLHNAIE